MLLRYSKGGPFAERVYEIQDGVSVRQQDGVRGAVVLVKAYDEADSGMRGPALAIACLATMVLAMKDFNRIQ